MRKPSLLARVGSILTLVLICLLAVVLISVDGAETPRRGAPFAGRPEIGAPPLAVAGSERPRRLPTRKERALLSENLVVDTLNLVHWLGRRTPQKTVDLCDIIAAIDETAPILRKQYPGRVIFVTKGRETRAEPVASARARALYQAASRRNHVHINIVERLPGGIEPGKKNHAAPHAALGRDDFYLIMLAWKLHCPVLSRDRFRDLPDMKAGHLDKFHVYSYSPVKALPERDYVNPAAAEFAQMHRPALIDYSDVLPHL